jgi:NAD(P)-dependent dehydrogenase (short-subunit alcohol dehydrogenase family)
MPERYVVSGASSGLGAAVARHLAARGDAVIGVSRRPVVAGQWVAADLATEAGLAAVPAAVGDAALDGLLYMGGTWERGAFTADYAFERSGLAETQGVLAVNLIAPVDLARRLLPALARSANPRIVLLGALSAHPGQATPEVANTASKSGLMGAAEALRLALRGRGIGVTVINPGNVATDEVLEDIATGRFEAQEAIPMADLLATLDYVLSLSAASEVRVIDLAQRSPGN